MAINIVQYYDIKYISVMVYYMCNSYMNWGVFYAQI